MTVATAPIVVLGGRTSRRDRRSEAEAGRAWLVARGIPPGLVQTEDGSRNTLENLRAVRARFADEPVPPVLISNRYHLHRCLLLAGGLGLVLRPCAAEARLRYTPAFLGRLLLEALFVNWYCVGRFTARLLRHRGMLARIG